MGKLDGKTALITGAARGIGKAIALGVAREGANTVLADINIEGLTNAAAAVAECGVKGEMVPTDVTNEDQIEALFKQALVCFGRLDILVNNAGVFNFGPLEQMPTATWDKVIATDLRAPFLCTRAAFRIMKAQGGGRIINIGSISASRVRANNAAYSAAKAGLVSLTHTTELELIQMPREQLYLGRG